MKKGTIMICLFLFLCSTGCSKVEKNPVQMKNQGDQRGIELDFTICKEENIPGELKKIIDEKKEVPFQISFFNSAYLYYVVGYGVQPTSGYSILVEEVKLQNEKIYVNTTLVGPEKKDKVEKEETFPYVVIKLPKREEDVVFEV